MFFFVICLIIETFFHSPPYIPVGVVNQVFIFLGKNYLIIASKIDTVSEQTDCLCHLYWLKHFLEDRQEVAVYIFKVYSQSMTKKDNTFQNLVEAI